MRGESNGEQETGIHIKIELSIYIYSHEENKISKRHYLIKWGLSTSGFNF